MNILELFLAQLDREAAVSRRALERVPEGRPDWKPHEKSMALGYLATLVATMPSWVAMAITQDSLDLNPPTGPKYQPPSWATVADLARIHDDAVGQGRHALKSTTEAHLMTTWKLLVGGNMVMENPRHVVIEDTFTHLAHHRGQLSVYLRLNAVAVPALYGPSADDRSF